MLTGHAGPVRCREVVEGLDWGWGRRRAMWNESATTWTVFNDPGIAFVASSGNTGGVVQWQGRPFSRTRPSRRSPAARV
ncbi:hypothetical protein [Streptomyces sp. NPDC059909]|uniref:hypothetical protein n=1 Tax=Streptomyces sp. NPDC059909 TaxID=3346998 RepID=UPI003663091B